MSQATEHEINHPYNRTIAIDFDGPIHRYSDGWRNGELYDIPTPGAFDAIRRLKAHGWTVVIFTTRGAEAGPAIRSWALKYLYQGGDVLLDIEITAVKPIAVAYIDDRAIRFINWRDAQAYFV